MKLLTFFFDINLNEFFLEGSLFGKSTIDGMSTFSLPTESFSLICFYLKEYTSFKTYGFLFRFVLLMIFHFLPFFRSALFAAAQVFTLPLRFVDFRLLLSCLLDFIYIKLEGNEWVPCLRILFKHNYVGGGPSCQFILSPVPWHLLSNDGKMWLR